jgi:outer membrane protein assembly factor BamB
LNPARDTLAHITLDEEVVISQASSGIVTAFDSETGRRFWSTQLGRTDLTSFAAVTNQEQVIVIAGTKVYGVQKYTGELLWNYQIPEQPSVSPAMDENNLYVGTLKGSVYAYNLANIQELYEDSKLEGWAFQASRWSYKTGQEILTPPVTNGRVVTVANQANLLYSIGATRGKTIFHFETEEPVSAPMAYRDDWILMASQDFRLFCIDMNNGSLRWIYPSGRPITKAPVVIGQNVFLTPEFAGLFCLDLETGEKLWWRQGIKKFLTATPDLVFATDESEHIAVLNRKTGAPVGNLPLDNYSVQLGNDRTDRLYLATKSGRIVCIRQKGRTFPIYHKHPERRPIMPEFAPDVVEPPADDSEPAAADPQDPGQT